MQIYYTDHFVLPLPEGHRFPMSKYARLRERVAASGIIPPHELVEPAAATEGDKAVADYVVQLRPEASLEDIAVPSAPPVL